MDYNKFLNAVRRLNEDGNFFGNLVLYEMAARSALTDPMQLAGTMWLIGRSYAASPQRRSYGTDKKENWPVRSNNDGRDEFFSFIANHLELPELLGKERKFAFDRSEKDLVLLQDSISFVLQFNIRLSQAIEIFDYADKAGEYCTNHISFCSKFLHFYYPHAVFIIDTYAQAGANRLFGKYRKDKSCYICDPDCPDSFNSLLVHANSERFRFDKSVYDIFTQQQADRWETLVLQDQKLQKTLADYENRKPENASIYITHCVRSYLLGCMLQKEKIAPSAKLAGEDFCSMPRLIDTVFLNVKGDLTKAELDRFTDLAEKFGDRCEEYEKYKKWLSV